MHCSGHVTDVTEVIAHYIHCSRNSPDYEMFDLSGLYQVLPDHAEPVPVPLLSVEVRAEVRNFIAEVELRQKYQNREENPLEVTYFFPVEEEASVIGCKALLDGKKYISLF